MNFAAENKKKLAIALATVSAAEYFGKDDEIIFVTEDGEIREGKILKIAAKDVFKVTDKAMTQMWTVGRDQIEKIETPEVARAKKRIEVSKLSTKQLIQKNLGI